LKTGNSKYSFWIRFAGGVLLMPLLLFALLHNPKVQTFLLKKALSYYTNHRNLTISIQDIEIELFKSIRINHLLIGETPLDTLAFADKIEITLKKFSFSSKIVSIDSIKVNQLKFRLITDSLGSNLDKILYRIAGENKDTTKSQSSWTFALNTIKLTESSVSILNKLEKSDSVGVNFGRIIATHLNLEIDSINLQDTLSFRLKKLALNEISGFNVDSLKIGRCKIYNQAIDLKDFAFRASNTNLLADTLALKFKSWADFDDFEEKVSIHLNLKDSTYTDLGDIAYFVHSLWGMHLRVKPKWKSKGPAKHLQFSDLDIAFGQGTRVLGKLKVEGLLQPETAIFNLKTNSLVTNRKDIETLYTQISFSPEAVQLPEILDRLGLLEFSGTFLGSFGNYDFSGNIATGLGQLNTVLQVFPDSSKITRYQLNMAGENFWLGKFIGLDSLVRGCDFDFQANGPFGSDSLFRGQYQSDISRLHINNYELQNITLTGALNGSVISAKLKVDDDNLSSRIFSRLDFSQEKPIYNFAVTVSEARLHELNIDKSGFNSNLNFDLVTNLSGDSLENLTGKAIISDFHLWKAGGKLWVDSFNISLEPTNLDQKLLTVQSDLFSAKIRGNYTIPGFWPSFQSFSAYFLPSVFSPSTTEGFSSTENLFFDLKIGKLNNFFDYFNLDHGLSEGSRISGYFDNIYRNLTFTLRSSQFKIFGQSFSDILFNIHKSENSLVFDANTKKLGISGLNFQNFNMRSNLRSDSMQIDMKWENSPDTLAYKGNISTLTTFSRNQDSATSIKTSFFPSEINIGHTHWQIPESTVQIDSNHLVINNFHILNGDEELKLDGTISPSEKDTISLDISKINLNILNIVLANPYYNFGGKYDGNLKLTDFYGQRKIFTTDSISNFSLNRDTLGTLVFSSFWNNDLQRADILANIHKFHPDNGNEFRFFETNGQFFPFLNKIDFKVKMKNFPLSIVNKPVEGVFSNISGRLSTDSLRIAGQINHPDIRGFLKLQRTNLKVDYLNTNYSFADSVEVTKNAFILRNTLLTDETGNTARINGNITHSNFRQLGLNLNVNANNFLMLNTTASENSLYFGRAKASGLVKIGGTPDFLQVSVSAKTEKGTNFFIPLNTSGELSENKFLTFAARDTSKEKGVEIEEYKADLSGIQLDFDMDVTPDAEVQLIFDQKVGDIIKGRGKGNIKMRINTQGQFNMYGDYTIEKGDYLFTLKNFINKKFDIERGSTIIWDGDPYNAKLNINTSYKIKRAPLYDLLYDEEFKETRAPVNCKLIMSNQLTRPTISFGVEIKGANDKIQEQLNALTSDEINKQFLSLLVINKFQPLPGINPVREKKSNEYTSGVSANASELLTNQLNHWLSQISPGFDIGVNYRATDSISRNQIEIALSKQLFNDRITINGNLNMRGQQGNTQGSNFTGEYEVEYKITKNGKLSAKYFGKPNENLIYETSAFKQGITLLYREEFNTIGELFRRYYATIFKKKAEAKATKESE
jgi:hypothetical protein